MESTAKERSERCFARAGFGELAEKRKFCDQICDDVEDLLLLLLKRSEERVKALNIYTHHRQSPELLILQLGGNMLVFASLPLLRPAENGIDRIRCGWGGRSRVYLQWSGVESLFSIEQVGTS